MLKKSEKISLAAFGTVFRTTGGFRNSCLEPYAGIRKLELSEESFSKDIQKKLAKTLKLSSSPPGIKKF
jgi:hypothetical protein